MISRSNPWQQPAPRSGPSCLLPHLASAFAALVAVLVTGCASPGPPRPPSLNLPQPVTNLTARRVGNDVLLNWTTPAKSTDGLDLKGSLTAQLCREAITSASQPSCAPILRLAVHPGASTAAETLPQPLTSDPVQLLTYRVRIENAANRAAALSNPAYAAAGSAPPSVEDLHATPIKAGALIQWRPQPTPAAIELDRIDPALIAAPKSAAKSKSSQPLQLAGQETAEVHLRAVIKDQSTGSLIDPGGTLDSTTRKDETYTYTAQRVRAVLVGGHPLEIRTPPSPPLTVAIRDVFPPPTPTGLAAVPGSVTHTPDSQPQPSIDLSWEPVSDPDLAGYLVYRRQLPGSGTPTRLTPAPVVSSAFSDLTARPGQHYAYRVTAVDNSGNESPPSSDVQEALPLP